MPKPTIVLVHGAWADASSWNAVSTELRGQGYTVFSPPNLLRGVATRRRRTSPRSWRSAPPDLSSWSATPTGASSSPTLRRSGDDVKALVYVDAFVPDEGETVFQILGGSGSALDVPDPTTVLDLVTYPGSPEGDLEAFLKPDTVHQSFAQDLEEADRWLIVESQRPITLGANTTPSGCGRLEQSLPSWAVVGHGGPGHPAGHAAQHGGACGSDDHRGGRFTRLDGLHSPRSRSRRSWLLRPPSATRRLRPSSRCLPGSDDADDDRAALAGLGAAGRGRCRRRTGRRCRGWTCAPVTLKPAASSRSSWPSARPMPDHVGHLDQHRALGDDQGDHVALLAGAGVGALRDDAALGHGVVVDLGGVDLEAALLQGGLRRVGRLAGEVGDRDRAGVPC